jgi:hypothetical protein
MPTRELTGSDAVFLKTQRDATLKLDLATQSISLRSKFIEISFDDQLESALEHLLQRLKHREVS